MSNHKLDKSLFYLEKILAWSITILCSLLGIIFIALAKGDLEGYSYGAIFVLTAIIIAPINKFPIWVKIAIAGIMAFLIL